MLYCVAWTIGSRAARYGCVLVLSFLLVFTGFGMFMGPITLALMALDCWHSFRGRRRGPLVGSVVAVCVSIATIRLFLQGYSLEPTSGAVSAAGHRWWDYPWFVCLMLSNSCGLRYESVPIASTAVGAALLGAMLVVLVRCGWAVAREGTGANPVRLVITILLAFEVLFCATTAAGRIGFGTTVGQTPRYVTLLIPVFLGLYFWVLSLRSGRLRRGALAAGVALLILGQLPLGLGENYPGGDITRVKRSWKVWYLSTESIEAATRYAGYPIHPMPGRTRLQEKLDYLKQHRLNLYRDAGREGFGERW
jgi:hypothetical protein